MTLLIHFTMILLETSELKVNKLIYLRLSCGFCMSREEKRLYHFILDLPQRFAMYSKA